MNSNPTHGMAQVILPQSAPVDSEQPAQMEDVDMRSQLKTAIGHFVVCKFLIGTDSISTLSGIMKAVGTNFCNILDPCTNTEICCDIYSLKFISIYPEGVPDYQMYCNRRLYEQQYI